MNRKLAIQYDAWNEAQSVDCLECGVALYEDEYDPDYDVDSDGHTTFCGRQLCEDCHAESRKKLD